MSIFRTALVASILLVPVTGLSSAHAEQFEFAPPSHIKLNRLYRVDKLNGEITACQYGATEGSLGVTLCYPSGEGAVAQAPGDYGLMASHHVDDGGIFRINRRTGDIAICYVLNAEKVVCTPNSSDKTPLATGSVEAPKIEPQP
jgi:hypothetical protein